MWLVDFLAKRIRPIAIPNLTLLILAGQIILYLLFWVERFAQTEGIMDKCYLLPREVLQGEVWRLLTFVFIPPFEDIPLFFIFYCMLFYLMGTVLEARWGTARFNVFLFVGYIANVVAALILYAATGINSPGGAGFVNGSIFLAFAYLYPDFLLMIFFIFPVKIKWLALVQWLTYAWLFSTGGWMTRVLIAATTANFLLFFGGEILQRMYFARRSMKWRARQLSTAKIRHRCTTCGITSETHPEMDFRYCSKCYGSLPYCSEHLKSHVHVTEEMQKSETGAPVS